MGKVRIIAGRWRGRRLSFPEQAGLRPTPNRLRETLFNWLAPWLEQSSCLDLFAGSGALGIEALSRGAATVTFVESNRSIGRVLRGNLEMLGASDFRLHDMDAQTYLGQCQGPFDIVFLDPPFAYSGLSDICIHLQEYGCVADGSLIYVEQPSRGVGGAYPGNWRKIKQQRAGEVVIRLFQVDQTKEPLIKSEVPAT